MIVFLILVLFLVSFSPVFSQEKFEKERRIKVEEVPPKALSFMDSLHFQPKIRWYLEEGISNKSVEAKFRRNQARYSVEFNEMGEIEDIEKEIEWEDIDLKVRQSMNQQLGMDCTKYKKTRVQRQFTGSRQELFAWLNHGQKDQNTVIKYEIVVRCRKGRQVDLYEYLFDAEGEFVTRSKIVFRKSSHLEY
jgi:hypothetical protein